MRKMAYRVFVDVWRLAAKYNFQKLNDEQWERFIDDGDYLYKRYKGTLVEQLYRELFSVVQSLYERLGKERGEC